MKKLLIGLITLSSCCALAQPETPVSVYSCSAYSSPTQAEILAEPDYIRSCIELNSPGNYLFQYNNDILLQSFSSIHVDPNTVFHAGPFTGSGNAHLKSDPTSSPFDIAVMNSIDMNHVPKLQKLELGIQLDGFILSKIYNFINNANVPSKDKLNPFVDWDIDVEATFTNGTQTKVIDGFFYRNFSRNTSTDDWDEIATNYPFRVRFSPPTTGNWECQINIKIGGVVAYTSTNFWFNVIDLGAHGYVKVHDNNRNLELDGEIIFPVGQNFPYPQTHKRDQNYLTAMYETNKVMTVTGWLAYHQDLIDYHGLGGKYVRISQGASSSLIEFEKKGNYYDRLHYAWETDKYIKYCDDNGILVNFNLLFQEPLFRYAQSGEWKFDFSHYMPVTVFNPVTEMYEETGEMYYMNNDLYKPYCYNDTPLNAVDATSLQTALQTDEAPHNMFIDEDDLKYHEQRMRYYIARYGYSTSIMQFELLSESFHLDQFDGEPSYIQRDNADGAITRNAINNYINRISSYTKNTLGHTEHLMGVHAYDNYNDDTSGYNTEYGFNYSEVDDPSCNLGVIDVIGFSMYRNKPDRLMRIEEIVQHYLDTYSKPVMFFEQGVVIPGAYDNHCSDFDLHKQDVKTVGFTGCAGFFPWEGSLTNGAGDQQQYYDEVSWPSTIRSEQWMNSQKVIDVLSQNNGNWSHNQQAGNIELFGPNLKEIHYFVDSQDKHAVGVINNRTFNCSTHDVNCPNYSVYPPLDTELETRTDIEWNDGNDPLFVYGLEPNSNYRVHYYDFLNGNELAGSPHCYETGLSETKIKMKHPMIDGDDLPLLWFTVDKEDCNPNGLAQTNQEAPQQIVEGLLVDNGNSENVTVSPNPFIKELNIQIAENAEFVIYSGNYEKVYSGKVSNGRNQLNLEFLSRGVYFLKLSTSDKMYKIVKI